MIDFNDAGLQDDPLDGFDLDLVGFQCVLELDVDTPPDGKLCPFTPGCGRQWGHQCPLELRRLAIAQGTRKLQ